LQGSCLAPRWTLWWRPRFCTSTRPWRGSTPRASRCAWPPLGSPPTSPHPATSLTRAPPSFPLLAAGGGAELVGGGLQRPHAPLRLQHGRVHRGGQRGGESRPPHRPALPQRSAFRAAAFGTHGLTSPLHPCTPLPQSIRLVSHAQFPTALEVGP
jgi:hypothetical protein